MKATDCISGRRAGFTLLWTAIVLTLGGAIIGWNLPSVRNDTQRGANTVDNLSRVERGLTGYMALTGRLPCPADGQYAVNESHGYFGLEAATPGTCTGGTPAANFSDNGNVVGSMIPTRTLGLDDSYAF